MPVQIEYNEEIICQSRQEFVAELKILAAQCKKAILIRDWLLKTGIGNKEYYEKLGRDIWIFDQQILFVLDKYIKFYDHKITLWSSLDKRIETIEEL